MKKLILWLAVIGIALSSTTMLRPTEFNITYSDLFLVAAAVLAAFVRWDRSSILGNSRVKIYFGCGIVLFYLGFLLALTQGDPLRFLLVSFQYAFCFFLLPYLLSRVAQISPNAMPRGARMLLWGLALTSFIGLLGYFLFYEQFIALNLIATNGRFQGLVDNPNRFSALITVTIPLLFGLRALRMLSQTALMVISICYLAGLVVASSFGGLLSAAATLAVIAVFSFKPGPAFKGLVAIGVVGAILIASFGVPEVFERRVLSKFEQDSVDSSKLGSLDERVAVAEEAMGRIAQNPVIGAGLDNYLERSSFGHTVHNTMLLVWAEGGIVAFLGLLVIGLMPLASYLILTRGRVTRTGLAVSLGFTISLFMTMQVFAHLYSRAWFVPYFMTIWLIGQLAARRTPAPQPPPLQWGRQSAFESTSPV